MKTTRPTSRLAAWLAFLAGRFGIAAAAPVSAIFPALVRVGHCAFARPAATVLNGYTIIRMSAACRVGAGRPALAGIAQ
jgi:hypothetical protein